MHDLFGDEPPETNAGESLQGERHASRTTFGQIARRKRLKVAAISAVGALAVAGAALLVIHRTSPVVEVPPTVVATPPPAPAPVVPAEVKVRISSAPLGAEVFLGDETTARGRTPLTIRLPRDEQALRVIVKLEGYQAEPFDITPDSDQQVQASMVKAPSPSARTTAAAQRPHPKRVVIKKEPKPRPAKAAPDLKRGDVVDPFAR
jgi:hypothetical protein